MANKLKKILISVLSSVAFLVAGIFFVGCGVDYGKISLTASEASVQLEVGQTAQITFTIEGYQKGFSNRVKANPRSDSATAAFSAGEPVYVNDSQFTITITALAGGHGQLNVCTLEGAKECNVDVDVKQYATSLQSTNKQYYVSNQTEFKPMADQFVFNPNTTEKQMSFFYLPSSKTQDITQQSVVEVDLQNNQIVLNDGMVVGNLQKFEVASLSQDNKLMIDNEEKEDVGNFLFMALYDYSVESGKYAQPLAQICSVNILPDLKVKTYGGYQLEDGSVKFEEINLDGNTINIVRGNGDMSVFVLKLETVDTTQAVDINFLLLKDGQPLKDENNPFDIDEYHNHPFEKEDNVKYFKIALKDTLQQISADVKLSVSYTVAKDIQDESVNVVNNFVIATLIAPSKLLVNGKGAEELASPEEKIDLYYTYKHPDYGWKDLDLEVVSASGGLSPDFEYVYFEFNDSCFDLKYKDIDDPIASGQHITNLDRPFSIRGSGRAELDDVPVVIHLKSNFIEGADEIVTTVYFKISRGVDSIYLADEFNKDALYLDMEKGVQDFSHIIYTKSLFQSVSWQLVGGTDVVNFLPKTLDGIEEPICKYSYEDQAYYLNLSVAPKAKGTGRYKLVTDNGTESMFDGTEAVFTFNCESSLQPESTYISVLSENPNTIYDFYKTKSENAAFDDNIFIEIQNDNVDGAITFDKAVRFQVVSNASVVEATSRSDYFKLERRDNNAFLVVTKGLGDGKIDLVLSGFYIENFARTATELVATVFVSSYANVSEFTLKNGEKSALSNVVYYGGGSEEDASVTFTPQVVSEDCNNFYMYHFTAEAISNIYANKEFSENGYYFDNANRLITQSLLHEKYNRKFIYFYAQNSAGNILSQLTETKIQVVWQHQNQLGETVTEEPIEIALRMSNGLMIYADDETFEFTNADGQIERFVVTFSNVYQIGGYGQFDINTLTFKYSIPDRSVPVVLVAELSQKKGVQPTKRFQASIYPIKYISVENISLLSGLNQSQIDFSNEKLSANIGVTTLPSNSTSKDLVVEVVMTNGNTHRQMLSYVIDDSRKDNGIFNIKLYCNNLGLENVQQKLTCRLYIFPKEWGTTYTQINPTLQPIVIDVQYRNGSQDNPYVLETAEDVLKIGANEAMLKSHYEILNVVDMANVRAGATPIGIINGRLVGFSGTIVGRNSQAAITNLHVTDGNFKAVVDGVAYQGLFAKINENAQIENVLVGGDIWMTTTNSTYASLFAAINEGTLVNVGVTVQKSQINAQHSLHFGAVAAINLNSIVQDFTQYDSGSKFEGQTSKNLAYFNDYVSITLNTTNAYIGGIVGANNGKILRVLSDTYKMYGYTPYSAYALFDIQGSCTNVYVGGGAGVSSFRGAVGMPFDTLMQNRIEGLLIGGQISALSLASGTDYLGGIVGYVSEFRSNNSADERLTTITNSTSRVFVQGQTYVGGIVGFDNYVNATDGARVEMVGNAVQAVDHLLNSFEAANIIRLHTSALEQALQAATSDEASGEQKLNYFALIAVGNAYQTQRPYTSQNGEITSSWFNVESYVLRTNLNKNGDANGSIISSQNANRADYYGDFLLVKDNGSANFTLMASYEYAKKDVDIQLQETPYKMKSASGKEEVYFMHYFRVSGDLAGLMGDVAQENISQLNQHSPNDEFYPFVLKSQYVSLDVGTSKLIAVDANGMLSVKDTGLAELTLSSILNEAVSRKIYLFIVNYFDKDITSSIFYTAPSLSSDKIVDNQTIPVFGEKISNLYVVPTYASSNQVKITDNGVLYYNGVAYNMVKNTQISVAEKTETETEDGKQVNYVFSGSINKDYTTAQIYQQTIVFQKFGTPNGGDIDKYCLVPVLRVTIDGEDYIFELTPSQINLKVQYQETATAIRTQSTKHSIQTNGEFSDVVSIESANKEERLYYKIEKDNGVVVQQRTKTGHVDEANYLNYLNKYNEEDLFVLHFTRQPNTTNFNLTCNINTQSTSYLNRYAEGKSIFGHYTITFYANLLDEGVTHSIDLQLSESTLNYIGIINHSNFNDFSNVDQIVVPSQKGLLEISLDPVDSIFEQFYISDSVINAQAGAGRTIFKLAYENVTALGSQYVSLDNFGGYDQQNRFTFTYAQLLEQFKQLKINYNGKIYISYLVESASVKDNVNLAFDVLATHGNNGQYKVENTIPLRTKLSSYAKLQFINKEAIGGEYYLARGLSYDLVLDTYGFNEDQISFEISNSQYVSLTKTGGKYVLRVTSGQIQDASDDASSNRPGRYVTITTKAQKTVNNVLVETEHKLSIYLMEYVLNYGYIEGQYQDIVKGMEDGVINIAVGNPFKLESNLRAFMEYDSSNAEIAAKVENLLADLSANMTWTVYENNRSEDLQQGKNIASESGLYSISSFTFTPLKLYNHTQNLYSFSVGGYYVMSGGEYKSTTLSQNANRIYTQFSFDVHEQSTQDSPIPVYTYEDLMDMDEGEWYILLNDITLPDTIRAASTGEAEFKPITTAIAGLDGNGKTISLSGIYDFNDLTQVGLFASVGENTILQNIKMQLETTKFNMNVETFNVGLIAAENNGIITNCSASTVQDATLSVDCSSSTNSSFVAGLVGQNMGFITNCQSGVDIITTVNLAGAVGSNSGHIASSFYRGAALVNTTSNNACTGGFVARNSGSIYACYVSGDDEDNSKSQYYKGERHSITANADIAGFAFENNGYIYDCYSNLYLQVTGYNAAGFVFRNSGHVERCLSTSVLESGKSSNRGFAYENNVSAAEEGDNGIFDCFFLKQQEEVDEAGQVTQEAVNVNAGDIVLNDDNKDLTNIKAVNLEGLQRYDGEGKEKEDWAFKSFVVEDGRNINSVWFYNDKNNTDSFDNKIYNIKRIELVAANIIATPEREFVSAESVYDTATGATYVRYIYKYSSLSPALGTLYNPILISNAEEFEAYIVRENNASNINKSYYRLISDIDYTEYALHSATFQTKFLGYFEGNFMTINGIKLLSSEKLEFGGLFAQVGSSTHQDAVGTVMNFTMAIGQVDFANAKAVGAIAGKLDGGKILNVSLTDGEGVTVVGNNIVGGAVGLCQGEYKIQNVYSTLSAISRNKSVKNNNYNDESGSLDGYSFAGSVVGVLSGTGVIINTVSNTVVAAIADKAGLLFGFVDKNVVVQGVTLENSLQNTITASSYAGLIAGQSAGNMKDITINGDGNFDNINLLPNAPIAVGGVAGLVSGGKFEHITVNQSIVLSEISSDDGVDYIGGVAGQIVSNVSMTDVEVNANIVGFKYVGSVAGNIESSGVSSFNGINVSGQLSVCGVGQIMVGIGGLAGCTDLATQIHLSAKGNDLENRNTFDITANIRLYSYDRNIVQDLHIGAIIGQNGGGSHLIESSDSMLQGDCVLTQIGEGFVDRDYSVSVNEGELEYSNVPKTILDVRNIQSQASNYNCNVVYKAPMFVGADGVVSESAKGILHINLFGVPVKQEA